MRKPQNHDPPTLNSIRSEYDELAEIDGAEDPWHVYTSRQIAQVLQRYTRGTGANLSILNAGSGSNALGIMSDRLINLDLSEISIRNVDGPVIGDVQQLPIRSRSVDRVICTGSVLNYCDAARAIAEISRVLKPQGSAIIEFERAQTLEYIGTPTFRREADLVDTFYRGRRQTLWVYSEAYVRSLVRSAGLVVADYYRFHIISPLVLRCTGSVEIATRFTALDQMCARLNVLSKFACNVILVCVKAG
jgi:SAM-dependent methyltransferase